MKNTSTGNFNPKRISQLLEYRGKGKYTVSEVGDKLGISPPQAYKWCVKSPEILDKIHLFCKETGLTFEEIYQQIKK
jgi:hypothetical protein